MNVVLDVTLHCTAITKIILKNTDAGTAWEVQVNSRMQPALVTVQLYNTIYYKEAIRHKLLDQIQHRRKY